MKAIRKSVIVLLLLIIATAVYSDAGVSAREMPLLDYEVSESESGVAKAVTGRPSVALVLSGGGAKGIAFIPLLEEFERLGIPIDKVFGTSIGSLIGGLYCSGYSPREIMDICRNSNLMSYFTETSLSGPNEVFGALDYSRNNLVSVSFGKPSGGTAGFVDNYKVMSLMYKLFGNIPDDIDFNRDLVIPFECNATDMQSGEEVIFSEGSIITAMRASMSLPSVFEPERTEDGRILMDGGVVDNIMVHRARIEGFDIVICVSLQGYDDTDFDASLYDSISGSFSGYLRVVNRAMTLSLVGDADFWLGIDTCGYSSLDFDKLDEIAEVGTSFVGENADLLGRISSLFPEERKNYRDSGRTGEYYSRFADRETPPLTSVRYSRFDDFPGKTAFSLGVFGNVGFGFDFTDMGSRVRQAFYPTFRFGTSFKPSAGSALTFDTGLTATVGKLMSLSAGIRFCINPEAVERFYLTAGTGVSFGSLSRFTDIREPSSRNDFEFGISGKVGVMMTNGTGYNLRIFVSADNTWAFFNSDDMGHLFVPSVNMDFVLYPGYRVGLFRMSGSRVDVLARLGFETMSSTWSLKLGLAGEHTFGVSDGISIRIEGRGFSSREPLELRDSYFQYGGWRGMPGYSYDVLCNDFIYGGVGLNLLLSSGIFDDFISVVIRGGVRSSHIFGNEGEAYGSRIPFADCFSSGLWDLGISAGYGFSTPVGDVVLGFGINKDLRFALYLEVV